jgi:hypothetical protein
LEKATKLMVRASMIILGSPVFLLLLIIKFVDWFGETGERLWEWAWEED